MGPGSAVRLGLAFAACGSCPTAAVGRLSEIGRLEIDLRPLDARCDAYAARVDAGLATRPEVQEVVDRIDREQAATADDLVSEIELFLREQPGG